METIKIKGLDFSKANGLIPVVAQSIDSEDILMVAYANEEAVKMTLESGYAHYWSRSRQSIWKKGKVSGNFQQVQAVWVDCDGDTLIYRVHQNGFACHTGSGTCFFRQLEESFK